MQTCLKLFYLFICFFAVQNTNAQQDSALKPSMALVRNSDSLSSSKIIYSPRKAIVRSAIIPGWGQAINKKYWKIPIVYAALGTTTYLFFRNLNQFKDAKNAYILATDNDPSNDILIPQPYYSVKDQPERIRVFRNQVRQNIDYSVVFFMLFWGLNVVDAAVDAHLKTFDVSDKLSFQIKAGQSSMSNAHGLSIIVPLGK
jgi:hypothetical protein